MDLLKEIQKKTGITDEFLRSVYEQNDQHDCKADTPEGHCDHPSHPQI